MARFQFRSNIAHIVEINNVLDNDSDRKRKVDALSTAGFNGLTNLRLGSLKSDVIEVMIKGYDVQSRTFSLPGGKTIIITEQDVARVYAIPRGGDEILAESSTRESRKRTQKLAADLSLKVSNKGYVSTDELRHRLKAAGANSHTWARLYILHVMGSLMAPRNSMKLNLHLYAKYVESITRVNTYNWAGHVCEFLHNGLQTFITRKAVAWPEANMHLILVSIYSCLNNYYYWLNNYSVGA